MENALPVRQAVLDYAARVHKTLPDAPFATAPSYCVLRHAENKKWYALFMDVPAARLGLPGQGTVDIVDLKCDPALAGSLRREPGFLPAYHMHRDTWLTVLLDGTVPAETVCSLLDLSYELTLPRGKRAAARPRHADWLVPANPSFYDIEAALRAAPDEPFVWKQSTAVAVGDTVYLYLTAPVCAVRYKCRAVEVDIPWSYADKNIRMRRAMRLRMEKAYEAPPIGRALLQAHGVRAVRGPRHMPGSLIAEIEALYGG